MKSWRTRATRSAVVSIMVLTPLSACCSPPKGEDAPSSSHEFHVAHWIEHPGKSLAGIRLDALELENVSDKTVERLSRQPPERATVLTIRSSWIGSSTGLVSVTDEGIRLLADSVPVYTLHLEEQAAVTVDGIEYFLSRQQSLRELRITHCDGVTDAELTQVLVDYPNVRVSYIPRAEPPPTGG